MVHHGVSINPSKPQAQSEEATKEEHKVIIESPKDDVESPKVVPRSPKEHETEPPVEPSWAKALVKEIQETPTVE